MSEPKPGSPDAEPAFALDDERALPAPRKVWKTPRVITSEMSGARNGLDAYEDGAIYTNYVPS